MMKALIYRFPGFPNPDKVAKNLDGIIIENPSGFSSAHVDVQVVPNGNGLLIKVIPRCTLSDWTIELASKEGEVKEQRIQSITKAQLDPCFLVRTTDLLPLRIVVTSKKGGKNIAN